MQGHTCFVLSPVESSGRQWTTKLKGEELNAELISIDVGDAGSYQCKGIPVLAGQKYRCVLSPVESSGRQWTTKLKGKELNAELVNALGTKPMQV